MSEQVRRALNAWLTEKGAVKAERQRPNMRRITQSKRRRVMADDIQHLHNRQPDRPRQPRPGELLFEFHVERTAITGHQTSNG